MRRAPEHGIMACPGMGTVHPWDRKKTTEQWEIWTELSDNLCTGYLNARREPISYFATNLYNDIIYIYKSLNEVYIIPL